MNNKKFKYDGKSRPITDLYKENFDRIFGKKIDTKKEEDKRIEDPFKKKVKKENVNKKEIKDIEDRNCF